MINKTLELDGEVQHQFSERDDCVCCEGLHVYAAGMNFEYPMDVAKQLSYPQDINDALQRFARSLPHGSEIKLTVEAHYNKEQEIEALAKELAGEVIECIDGYSIRIDTGDRTSKENGDDFLGTEDEYNPQLRHWKIVDKQIEHDTVMLDLEPKGWKIDESGAMGNKHRILDWDAVRAKLDAPSLYSFLCQFLKEDLEDFLHENQIEDYILCYASLRDSMYEATPYKEEDLLPALAFLEKEEKIKFFRNAMVGLNRSDNRDYTIVDWDYFKVTNGK